MGKVTKISGLKEFKFRYEDIGGFEFANCVAKLHSAPTDNVTACAINKVTGPLKKGRDKITSEYKTDIMDKYATKDESGKVVDEGNGSYKPDETRLEEFKKAQEDFGNRTISFEARPIKLSQLKDVKLSARDFELLGDLVVEDAETEGPGIPDMPAGMRQISELQLNN